MCNYHRPVCVQCSVDMRPEKNGVYFIEDDGEGNAYKLWATDKWKCPECGVRVLIGFGKAAFSNAFEDDFKRQEAIVMEDPHTVREKRTGDSNV